MHRKKNPVSKASHGQSNRNWSQTCAHSVVVNIGIVDIFNLKIHDSAEKVYFMIYGCLHCIHCHQVKCKNGIVAMLWRLVRTGGLTGETAFFFLRSLFVAKWWCSFTSFDFFTDLTI